MSFTPVTGSCRCYTSFNFLNLVFLGRTVAPFFDGKRIEDGDTLETVINSPVPRVEVQKTRTPKTPADRGGQVGWSLRVPHADGRGYERWWYGFGKEGNTRDRPIC